MAKGFALGAAIFSGLFGVIWGSAISSLGPLAPRDIASLSLISAVLFLIAAVSGIKNIAVKNSSVPAQKRYCTQLRR